MHKLFEKLAAKQGNRQSGNRPPAPSREPRAPQRYIRAGDNILDATNGQWVPPPAKAADGASATADTAKKLGKMDFLKNVGKSAATLAAAAGVLGVAGWGASKISDAYDEKVTKKKAFSSFTERNKSWLKEHKPDDVQDRFNTLYTFSPEVAKDPLSASSFMKRSLAYAGEGVHINDLKTMSEIRQKQHSVGSAKGLKDRIGELTAVKGLGSLD